MNIQNFNLRLNNSFTGFFYIYFFVISLFGVASPYLYNLLPATVLFEILFLISFLMFSLKPNHSSYIIFSVSFACYVVFCFVYACLFNDVNVLDFLQAFKAFIYVSLLFTFFNKKIFEIDQFVVFFRIILLAFSLKYGYSRLFEFDELQGSRPGIFDENNFELILLLLMLFPLEKFKHSSLNHCSVWVFFLVVLSGSRSALIACIVALAFIHIRRFDKRLIYIVLVSPVVFVVAQEVFLSRMAGNGIEEIDRFKLFNMFLYEVQGWNLIDFIFGAPRLTPLSDATCLSLPYYDNLYSKSGDNSCYSVILHSYLMRVIFDHGIFGFLALISYVYFFLKSSKYDTRTSLGIILCVSASAASVSAFNSIYFALGVLFCVTTYAKEIR